ncbi:MAG TPA: DUF4189 domain-containing protein [Alphaproteobacteria bacterium]|nr:DUF4189 domain-containing protein [Alphaproteobacteria bacterium]
MTKPKLLGILASVIVAVSSAAPARASCLSDCLSGYGCGPIPEASGQSRSCGTFASTCRAECSHKSSAERPTVSHGAIAFSTSTGANGWSHDYADAVGARMRARDECSRYAKDCVIAVELTNECGAVATAEGGAVYWGRGTSEAEAKGLAELACSKDGGRNCAIKVSACALP